MYQVAIDTHTHTIASPHAYSTITELCTHAKEVGLTGIAMTDHGPSIADSPHLLHFLNMKVLPRKLKGVFLIKGAELTIIDQNGKVDLENNIIKKLEWVICSMHYPILKDLTFDEITNAYLNAIENPYIDCIGHMGQPKFQCDYEKIVLKAKELEKIIEINNNSKVVREGSYDNCVTIAKLCKKHQVSVAVSSDAHFHTMVGDYENAFEILKAADFPKELIINRSFDTFKEYIYKRRTIELEG